jgi:protein TonB
MGGIVGELLAEVHRIEPEYPRIAAEAHVEGMVILEATVDAQGCVQDVKVLRSRGSILDKAAIEAVQQWRYAPLTPNGVPTPWMPTVTLTFKLQTQKAS